MNLDRLLMIATCVMGITCSMEVGNPHTVHASEHRSTQLPQPDPAIHYAKWGRKAMEITHETFPQAAIQDYMYVGRFPQKSGLTDEVFRFVVSKDGDMKTVIVVLTVETHSQVLQESTIQNLENSQYKDISDRIVRQRH
jgi:hypothetical protein